MGDVKPTRDEIRAALMKRGVADYPQIVEAVEELLALQRERCARVAAQMNAPAVAGALGGTKP